MDDQLQELANGFFKNAYTQDWDSKEVSEDDMLRVVLSKMTATDEIKLKQLFLDVLKLDNGKIEEIVFYELGCQTKPFISYGGQYKHKDTKTFVNYLVSFIDDELKLKIQPLSLDGDNLRQSDGTLVATISKDLGEKAIAYGRLFSMSVEIVEFLESELTRAADEYELAFRDAEKFNTDVTQLGRGGVYGWRDRAYPDLPEWLQKGLRLVARIKGEGD